MLVPHIQQDSHSSFAYNQNHDLTTFFEYVDEIVLSNPEQFPDQENQEEQLTQVTQDNSCNAHFIIVAQIIIWDCINEINSKINPLGAAASVHIEIFAPPPNLS
jgi:hypothetical protein